MNGSVVVVVVDNEVEMWWHDHVNLNVHALVVGIVVVDVLVRVVFVETMTTMTTKQHGYLQ